MQNMHDLPRLRDSLTYLYVEYAILEKHKQAIECIQESGRMVVPSAELSVLLLGPGTSISHAAVAALGRTGCAIIWVGQDGTKYYAHGGGETRHARRLIHQARLASDPRLRREVVLRMYYHRFGSVLTGDLTLEQVRGKEGARVRRAYREASETFGVPWRGRRYDRGSWNNSDPINRALSSANALLNGICHTAIVSGGYSPALGFIHNGKTRSFVFDIADLYKSELTIPIAFEVVAESDQSIGKRVRALCRERFKEAKLLQRILPDIDRLLDVPLQAAPTIEPGDIDADGALPTELWDQIK